MSASQSPETPDHRAQFVSILNNLAKTTSPSGGTPLRKRGFVVIVRGGTSLKPLQTLCFEQTYNHCLTIRHRLKPKAAVGTLLAACAEDLNTIAIFYGAGNSEEFGGKPDIRGDVLPNPNEQVWKRFGEQVLHRDQGSLFLDDKDWGSSLMDGKGSGNLSRSSLMDFFAFLSDESTLSVGQRLVMFGELSEPAAEPAEWQTAMELVFRHLPERVGLVISNAPKDFQVPADDPHFLEIISADSADPQEPVEFYKYTSSSFIRDEPATKDELGVDDYANAIARFIAHRQTIPPLTVGIHGPWGKGKSSFMRLIESGLVKLAHTSQIEKPPELGGLTRVERWNDLGRKAIEAGKKAQANPDDEAAQNKHLRAVAAESDMWKQMESASRKNFIQVRFNAWQFEDAKQTWAGLAAEVSEAMESALSWPMRQWLKVRYAWRERKTELILSILMPLSIILLVTGLVIFGFFQQVTPEVEGPWGVLLKILLPTGSVLFTIWMVSSQIVKVAQPISERVLGYMQLPNYRDQMGFQHRVTDDLKFVFSFLNRKDPKRQLIVYIDDLDRCSENKIMEILQAINLILASCQFFVFVGMDTAMIYRAIKSHYREAVSDEFAENYLSKIIQISFFLPPSTQENRQAYLRTLFSDAARFDLAARRAPKPEEKDQTQPDLSGSPGELHYDLADGLMEPVFGPSKQVEDTADELQAFEDYQNFLDDNPREIKRLINIHRLIKILLQTEETSWSIPRQRKLVKWLIFCDKWPWLVDDLLAYEHSKILDCLADLVLKLKVDALNPEGTAEIQSFDRLEDFAAFSPNKGGKPSDVLSGEDIDKEFKQAADLSLLVRKSAVAAKRVANKSLY